MQSGPDPVVLGRWYHIAVVREGTTARMYLDGAQVAQVTVSGPVLPGPTPFWMGDRSGPQTFLLNGQLDEVGIWTRALTATEIAALAAR